MSLTDEDRGAERRVREQEATMNPLVILDAMAMPGERGYCRDRRYRITVWGREVKRCTYVFAVLGFGMVIFNAEKGGHLQVVNDCLVRGLTFGWVKVEQL